MPELETPSANSIIQSTALPSCRRGEAFHCFHWVCVTKLTRGAQKPQWNQTTRQLHMIPNGAIFGGEGAPMEQQVTTEAVGMPLSSVTSPSPRCQCNQEKNPLSRSHATGPQKSALWGIVHYAQHRGKQFSTNLQLKGHIFEPFPAISKLPP